MKKLLPFLLLLAACDGSHPTAADAVLDFRTEPGEGADAVRRPSFDGGDGELTVSGTVNTPCQSQPVEGELTGDGAAVVLRVRVRELGICLPAVDYVRYTARVTGLTDGTYVVRVLHEREWNEPRVAGMALVGVR